MPHREGAKVVGYLRKFDNRLLMSLISLNKRAANQRRPRARLHPCAADGTDLARGFEALAADAAERAPLPRHENSAVDIVGLREVVTPSGTPYEFGWHDADPPFRVGEASWDMVHNQASLQEIDDAVASIEAAQLSRIKLRDDALPAPVEPVVLPERKPDKPRSTTGISPRSGKSVRAYRAREAKPPFGADAPEADPPD